MRKTEVSRNESGIDRFQVASLLSPMLAMMLLAAPLGLLPSLFAKYYGVSLGG